MAWPRFASDGAVGNRADRHATLTLAGMMAAHALTETARDGLFLSRLPVADLPWAYLAIAGLTLLVSGPIRRLRSLLGVRRTLEATIALNVLGLVAAAFAIEGGHRVSIQALYVGASVGATTLVMQFWLALGEGMTLAEAKKRYARIAVGGALGALVGFALAASVAEWVSPETMILIAAGVLFAPLVGPIRVAFPEKTQGSAGARPEDTDLASIGRERQGFARVFGSRYSLLLVLLVSTATCALMTADFLFKTAVVDHVEPEQITRWLATIYLGLNAVAAAFLAFLATPLLRRIGLGRALLALPVTLVLGGFAATAGGLVLFGVGLAKLAEGSLRHSLHKTSVELLFLPLPEKDRPGARLVAEVVGDKGARAVCALVLAALASSPETRPWIPALLTVTAVVWVALAIALRQPYLDQFRRRLSSDELRIRLELPDLDVESVGTLLRALDSPDPGRVFAALRLLGDREAVGEVPLLILHHPSSKVVESALDLFAEAGRSDLGAHVDRLLDHEDAGVRAAATRLLGRVYPDPTQLEIMSRSECPCVRVSAIGGLAAHGWTSKERAQREFALAATHRQWEARLALARTAGSVPSPWIRDSLIALTRDQHPEVRRAAYVAMRIGRDTGHIEPLIESLVDRENRDVVLEALREHGDAARRALRRWLLETTTPGRIRRAIPSAIGGLGGSASADLLVSLLTESESLDPALRYSVSHALITVGTTESSWGVSDRARLNEVFERDLESAREILEIGSLLELVIRRDPRKKTRGAALLFRLIEDDRRAHTEHLFRLLDLLHPGEAFERIGRGLRSVRSDVRSSSLELLENLLPAPRARALQALSGEGADAEGPVYLADSEPAGRDALDELFDRIASGPNPSLRSIARYWSIEIGIDPSSAGAPTRFPDQRETEEPALWSIELSSCPVEKGSANEAA